MSLLSVTKKSLNTLAGPVIQQVNPYTYDGRGQQGQFFWPGGGQEFVFSYSGHNSSVKAYQNCPPVAAIINKKTQAFLNGKTWVLNTRGKEATGANADKLRKLLAQPNPLQSWRQFEAQQYVYTQLFGFCLLLPIKPVGYGNIDATSLWNIPPFMVDIEETQKLFYQSDQNSIIKKIVLTYKNEKTTLEAKDVYFMKDFTPSFTSLVIPESRICSLEMPINNIIGAYEARHFLIKNRGALGIISPESKDNSGSIPLTPTQKEALQEEYKRYGLLKGQWNIIISNAAIKWSQIGIATKDLMLFEEIDDDIMRLCDGFNYPYRLMASDKSNSLGGADAEVFRRSLYQEAILPEADNLYEQWTAFFGLDALNLRLEKDYSKVSALQVDQVNVGNARRFLNEALKIEFDNGLITINDWLAKLGDDPLPGELGNIRVTTAGKDKAPLGVVLGPTGVSGIIQIITASGLSDEAKSNILQILYGIDATQAAAMVISSQNTQQTQQQNQSQQQTQTTQPPAA